MDEIRKMLKNGESGEYQLQSLIMSMQAPVLDPTNKEKHRSDVNLPTFVKQNERVKFLLFSSLIFSSSILPIPYTLQIFALLFQVPLEVIEQLSSNNKLYKVILENYPSLLACRSTSDKQLNKILEVNENTTRVPVTFSMKLKKADKRKLKQMEHQVIQLGVFKLKLDKILYDLMVL